MLSSFRGALQSLQCSGIQCVDVGEKEQQAEVINVDVQLPSKCNISWGTQSLETNSTGSLSSIVSFSSLESEGEQEAKIDPQREDVMVGSRQIRPSLPLPVSNAQTHDCHKVEERKGVKEAGLSGYVNSLTQEQSETLEVFRKRLGSRTEHSAFLDRVLFLDCVLLRFLRAKSFDVDAAMTIFEKHLEFRKERHLDVPTGDCAYSLGSPEHLLPELPSVQSKYPHGFHGMDRSGRPIYIEQIGKMDIQKLFSVTTPERLISYFIHESERQTTHRFTACSLACGRLVESSLLILDLQGLSFRTVTSTTARKIMKDLAQIQQDQFPELMGKMVIVNAPKVFSVVWSLAKSLLDPKTVEKIEIFAAEPAKYMPRLLELISPENLPCFLGGSCCCSNGCMNSDKGPWNQPDIKQKMLETPYWEVLLKMERQQEHARPGHGAHVDVDLGWVGG